MSIPTLVIGLTLLGLLHALLWHNQTAEDIRHEESEPTGDTSR